MPPRVIHANPMQKIITDVIIPAYNEERSIGRVIGDIPGIVREVVVCDNGSTDHTASEARKRGAVVVFEGNPGYGNACLKGMEYLANKPVPPDVVVFLDGDYADYPEQIPELLLPVINEDCDLVIGSRPLGHPQPGSLTPPQVFGNWLATTLIRVFYGYRFTDLGPFRAIKYDRLLELNMKDKTYGWTVEMQVKAAKRGFRTAEVPVKYRPRIGVSKVSGTVKGTFLAGYKILWTIFKYI